MMRRLVICLLLTFNGPVCGEIEPKEKGPEVKTPHHESATDLQREDEGLEVDPDYPTELVEEAVAKAPKEVTDDGLEVDPDYPTELVEEAVAKAPKEVTDWLRREVSHVRERRSSELPDSDQFSQRMCSMIFREFRPREQRRSTHPQDFNLYNIVNLPDFVQTVETAVCAQNKSTVSSMDHASHECKQQYVKFPLISIVTNSTDLVVRSFSFPFGCTLFLKQN